MGSFYDESLFKYAAELTPGKEPCFFFPSGSLSSSPSILNSNSKRSICEYTSTENKSLQIITFESISYPEDYSKQVRATKDENSEERIEKLEKKVSDLKKECKLYMKQNIELRNELKTSNHDVESDKIASLSEEISRLKGKLQVHESMVEKLIRFTEGMCGESLEASENQCKVDFYTYDRLLSLLGQIKAKSKKKTLRIRQLKNDKDATTELLNFYISAAKLIKPKNPKNPTPDIPLNFHLRKNSELSDNSFSNLQFDDKSKKNSNLCTEKFTKPKQKLQKTLKNLKGISRLLNSTSELNKNKTCSYSVSPLLANPKKKSSKMPPPKLNIRSDLSKVPRNPMELKPKKNRCKS